MSARHAYSGRLACQTFNLINPILVALPQVRLTRNIDLVGPSSRTMARSKYLIAGGFALIAFASDQPTWVAVVFLLAGTLVQCSAR